MLTDESAATARSHIVKALLRYALVALCAIAVIGFVLRTPVYHTSYATMAADADSKAKPYHNKRGDLLVDATAILMPSYRNDNFILAGGFVARDAAGRVVVVTSRQVGDGAKSAQCIFADSPVHADNSVDALNLHPIIMNPTVSVFALPANPGMTLHPLPIASGDPKPGEIVYGMFNSNSAHPDRLNQGAQEDPFATVIDQVDGETVVYCRRCDVSDSGTVLVNAHGEVVGMIDNTIRFVLMRTEQFFPVITMPPMTAVAPASLIRDALKAAGDSAAPAALQHPPRQRVTRAPQGPHARRSPRVVQLEQRAVRQSKQA